MSNLPTNQFFHLPQACSSIQVTSAAPTMPVSQNNTIVTFLPSSVVLAPVHIQEPAIVVSSSIPSPVITTSFNSSASGTFWPNHPVEIPNLPAIPRNFPPTGPEDQLQCLPGVAISSLDNSSVIRDTDSDVNDENASCLYNFQVLTYVKQFKTQQNNKTPLTIPFSVSCNNFESLRSIIWLRVEEQILGYAEKVEGSPGTWKIRENSKSRDNLDNFMVFTYSSRSYGFQGRNSKV